MSWLVSSPSRSLSGFYFAQTTILQKQTAQLNVLPTVEGSAKISKEKAHYAVGFPFLLAASLIIRNLRSAEMCSCTRMRAFNAEIVSSMLCDDKDVSWKEARLLRLPSEILEFKTFTEKSFTPHCSASLFTSYLHLLNPLLSDLRKIGCFSYANAVSCKPPHVLLQQSYKLTSGRFTTRMHETQQAMSNTFDDVQKTTSRVHGTAFDT